MGLFLSTKNVPFLVTLDRDWPGFLRGAVEERGAWNVFARAHGHPDASFGRLETTRIIRNELKLPDLPIVAKARATKF